LRLHCLDSSSALCTAILQLVKSRQIDVLAFLIKFGLLQLYKYSGMREKHEERISNFFWCSLFRFNEQFLLLQRKLAAWAWALPMPEIRRLCYAVVTYFFFSLFWAS